MQAKDMTLEQALTRLPPTELGAYCWLWLNMTHRFGRHLQAEAASASWRDDYLDDDTATREACVVLDMPPPEYLDGR